MAETAYHGRWSLIAAQNASGFRVLRALAAEVSVDTALSVEREHLRADDRSGLDADDTSIATNLAAAARTLLRAIDTVGNVPALRLLDAVADRNAEVCFLQDVHEQLGGTGPYMNAA